MSLWLATSTTQIGAVALQSGGRQSSWKNEMSRELIQASEEYAWTRGKKDQLLRDTFLFCIF